jgi:hypothetical protein
MALWYLYFVIVWYIFPPFWYFLRRQIWQHWQRRRRRQRWPIDKAFRQNGVYLRRAGIQEPEAIDGIVGYLKEALCPDLFAALSSTFAYWSNSNM